MLVVITLILWCPPSPPLQQSSDSHCTLYTLYSCTAPRPTLYSLLLYMCHSDTRPENE